MEGDKELDTEGSRFNAMGAILLFYTFPLVALTGYTWWSRDSWNIWAAGLLLTSFGTYLLARLMHNWAHQALPQAAEAELPLPAETLPQTDEKVQVLEQQVQAYTQMVEDWKTQAYSHEEAAAQALREHEEAQGQLNAVTEEYEQYKLEAQHLIEEERGHLEAQRQTLVDQKNALEEKQEQIEHLEAKVRDLNYEIKTLLQLAEKEGMGEKRKVKEEALW